MAFFPTDKKNPKHDKRILSSAKLFCGNLHPPEQMSIMLDILADIFDILCSINRAATCFYT